MKVSEQFLSPCIADSLSFHNNWYCRVYFEMAVPGLLVNFPPPSEIIPAIGHPIVIDSTSYY